LESTAVICRSPRPAVGLAGEDAVFDGRRLDLARPADDEMVLPEEFQPWNLTLHPDQTATLACDDSIGEIDFSSRIEFTDFPLEEISLYFTNNTI
jgi:uncharacterized protein DUF6876